MLRNLLHFLAGQPHPERRARPLPVVGAMATMPSRRRSFGKMLASILPQLDVLYVFLDGYGQAPDCLKNGRSGCRIVPLPAPPSLHNASRFLVPAMHEGEALFLFLDDDILYPPDYVDRLVDGLLRYQYKAIVGFHGSRFVPPHRDYLRDRKILHFAKGLKDDAPVHQLGAGTLAFHSSVISPDPASWAYPRLDDLNLAIAAVTAGVDLIALNRRSGWLRPISENQADSIWRSLRYDAGLPTRLMHEILARQDGAPHGDWWQRSR